MKRALLCLWVLSLPLLAGCLGGGDDEEDREIDPVELDYDATEFRISGHTVQEFDVMGAGNTTLSAVAYVPVTQDALEDGSEPPFPVVVFMHGLGIPKEMWQNAPVSTDTPLPLPPTDLLAEFADAGLIAVAYDRRGHGASGGESSVAGAIEMADLDAVLDHVEDAFHTNGLVGVTGWSIGGALAYKAWGENPRVTTAVPHQGSVDLFESLMPGHVPKPVWLTVESAVGLVGTQTRQDDNMLRWFTQGLLRTNMSMLEAELDAMSLMDQAARSPKPILVCDALQDTLAGDGWRAWTQAAGFARAIYFTGGHATFDRGCWDATIEWFQFFLAGIDTEIDVWPEVQAVDASGDDAQSFQAVDAAVPVPFYLREPALNEYEPNTGTFSIQQQLLANPFHEPGFVWDLTGMNYVEAPEQLRQDPTAVFFESGAFDASQVLLGAPRLTLHATNGTADGPWQVAATLYHDTGGNLRILGRTAYAVLTPDDHWNGTVTLQFPWVKADLPPQTHLVLKLSGNDPTMFAPLLGDYTVTFDGTSRLDVPFFTP